MLKNHCGVRTGLAALSVGFCLVLAGPAASKTVYVWETEDGVSSFTDNEKHIPKRYRNSAKTKTLRSLSSYERFTPSDRKTSGDYAERLRSRLSSTRDLNRALASEGAGVHYRHRKGDRGLVQISGQDRGAVSVGMAGRRDGKGPVEVDEYRVQVGHEIATRHATIVSQDGEILTIVRDEPNVSRVGAPRIESGPLRTGTHAP